MNLFKIWTIGILASMLFLISACSDEDVDSDVTETEINEDLNTETNAFNTWDEDRDEALSSNEFTNALSNDPAFNNQVDLDDTNFRTNIYNTSDRNRDNQLTEDEFVYTIVWIDSLNNQDNSTIVFGEWDTNDNNVIDNEEFMGNWANKNIFRQIDKDNNGVIDKTEYILALYGRWDINDDGRIDSDEFQLYSEWANNQN